MHYRLSFLLPALAASAVSATIDFPCVGSGGRAGVCQTTTACSSAGGITIDGACPWDGANVKCCTKAVCANGAQGNCRWTSDCAGTTQSGLCPGPAGMTCCSSSGTGFGGYTSPSVPAIGACTANAVNGAKKVIAAWPNRVREVRCTRNCTCGAAGASDHCCGKAIDFMCSDAQNMATISGRQIAEWVMDNASGMSVKYVIWGQKIWYPRDGVKAWTSWTVMADLGNVLENHWYVEISLASLSRYVRLLTPVLVGTTSM